MKPVTSVLSPQSTPSSIQRVFTAPTRSRLRRAALDAQEGRLLVRES